MVVNINYEKEGGIERVSFKSTPTISGVFIILLLFGVFLAYNYFKFGVSPIGLPYYFYIIMIVIFVAFIIPRKTTFEYNNASKTLSYRKYGPTSFGGWTWDKDRINAREAMFRQTPVVGQLRNNVKLSYYLKLPFMFNVPSVEQVAEIGKFLDLSPAFVSSVVYPTKIK